MDTNPWVDAIRGVQQNKSYTLDGALWWVNASVALGPHWRVTVTHFSMTISRDETTVYSVKIEDGGISRIYHVTNRVVDESSTYTAASQADAIVKLHGILKQLPDV